ncbi:nucleophile aminohydrolase [Schizophyllum fasciatum]
MPLYIAVHGGAGYHAVEDRKATKRALKASIQAALGTPKAADSQRLEAGGSSSPAHSCLDTAHYGGNLPREDTALSAIAAAIRVLEDDEVLNAGRGSNLTESGTVECDAAVMLARPAHAEFGSVAAVSGVKNPVCAARAVLEGARRADALGRVPPLTLAGAGARDFAARHGVEVVPGGALITERARAEWEYWTARLRDDTASGTAEGIPKAERAHIRPLHAHQDTVGAVCLYFPEAGAPSAAAGVSSTRGASERPRYTVPDAGLVRSGRRMRSGGWRAVSLNVWMCSVKFTIFVVGTGEAIMRANLARRVAEELDRAWDAQVPEHEMACSEHGDGDKEDEDTELDVHQILYDLLQREFGHDGREAGWGGCDKPTVGVLVMVGNALTVRLYSAFTAAGMAVAYAREGVSGEAFYLVTGSFFSQNVRAHILQQERAKPGSVYVETHTLHSNATRKTR